MSKLQVGDILYAFFVNQIYYEVVSVSNKRVKTIRLKHNRHDTRYPALAPRSYYDKPNWFTKVDEYSASHHGLKYTRWTPEQKVQENGVMQEPILN